MSGARYSRRPRVGLVAVLVLVVGLSPLNPVLDGFYGARQSAQAQAPSTVKPADALPTRIVTLVTGDRVVVSGDQDVQAFLPAQGRPSRGFITQNSDGHTRVIPRDVLPLVPTVLDPDLFDITTIVRERGDDKVSLSVPVIVQGAASNPTRRAAVSAAVDKPVNLASINAVALKVDKAQAQNLGQSLAQGADQLIDNRGATTQTLTPMGKMSTQAQSLEATQNLSAIMAQAAPGLPKKIWLDRKVKAVWDPNLLQVGAPAVWSAGRSGRGVTVAVLDTGIDPNHPDLVGKVVAAKNFTGTESTDDRYGHGTHVASIIAGSGAASGGQRRGVAYDATLINAKVLNDQGMETGVGDSSSVIAGMQWVGQQKVDVANMSLGVSFRGDGTDPISQALDAISTASGTLFVVSAGNSGPDTVGAPGSAKQALTVGAVDSRGRLAEFSSYHAWPSGVMKPEITAPGVGVMAARATTLGPGGLYMSQSGTSMASPHVAGAAALIRAAHPSWSAQQVKAALATTAGENPSYSVYQQGGGLLNIPAALGNAVMPEQTDLNFGLFTDRGNTAAPVARTVTYTNTSTVAVTLNLSVKSPSAQVVSVSPQSVTVPAGGHASATVSVAAAGLPTPSLVQGEVVATPVGADASVDVPDGVPFALRKTGALHKLSVTVINATGQPDLAPALTVFDATNMTMGFRQDFAAFDATGTTTMMVPEGTYHLDVLSDQPTQPRQPARGAWMVNPQVNVSKDTVVTFDARQAQPLTVGVEGKTTLPVTREMVEKRTDAQGAVFTRKLAVPGGEYLATLTQPQPVTVGTWGSYLYARQQTKATGSGMAQVYSSVHQVTNALPGSVTLSAEQVLHMARIRETVLSPTGSAAMALTYSLRSPLVPGFNQTAKYPLVVVPGQTWTEYVQPGLWTSQAYWIQGLEALVGTDSARMENPDTHRSVSWFQAPLHPESALATPTGYQPLAMRMGPMMTFAFAGLSDGQGKHVMAVGPTGGFQQTSTYTLRRDGQVVGSQQGQSATFPVPVERGSYELDYATSLTLPWGSFTSSTTWSFPSQAEGVAPTPLPLPNLSMELQVDSSNRLAQPLAWAKLSLPFASMPTQPVVRVEASTDAGKTWRAAQVLNVRPDKLTVALPRCAPDVAVSLRLHAQAGPYAVTQTLLNTVRTASGKNG